ncbi:hypothetical protein D3C72_1032420 [compost metagenome]
MQHCLMADGHVLADVERVARVRMQYGAFLHIAVDAHGDAFVVAANRGAKPYGRIRFQGHLADHVGRIGNKSGSINLWRIGAQLVECHR